jgi:RHS repeat-associated protein
MTELMERGMRKLTVRFWRLLGGLAALAIITAATPAGAVLQKTVEVAAVGLDVIKPEDGSAFPLSRGSSTAMVAKVTPSGIAELEVIWSIVERDPGVNVTLRASGANKERLTLTADEGSADGKVVLQAAIKQAPSASRRVRISIGCNACEGVACDAFVRLSSVEVDLSLGKARRGLPAGELYLSAKQLTPDLATPKALQLSALSEDVEEIRSQDGSLRQVIAPEKFVDIVVRTPYTYDINFYAPSARGAKEFGLYTVLPGFSPQATWRVEDPDATPGSIRRLSVAELESWRQYKFGYDAAQNAWSLAGGGGLQVRSRSERTEGADRIVTETLKNNEGVTASVERTRYRSYPWGEEIVEQVTDPDGAALTTTSSYNEIVGELGYGKLASRQEPDGSWVRYAYDAKGRVVREVRSWLDAPVGSPEEAARVTINDYASVDPADTLEDRDESSPRTVTVQLLGVTTSISYYAMFTDRGTGNRVEIVERAATATSGYGDPANERTVRFYNRVDSTLAGSGLIQRMQQVDGRLETYEYEYGTLSVDDDPSLSSFEPGSGTDVREMVTHGTVAHPEGIALKSTRETAVRNRAGLELLRETYVRTESGYERIQWSATAYDDRGRLTHTSDSTGGVTDTEWDCCGKTSERDAQGNLRYFYRDDLQRVVSESTNAWPSWRSMSYVYDAAGRVRSRTVNAGSLSQTTATAYDGSGRILTTTNEAGLTTSNGYEDGGRKVTVTSPGGATEVTERYLDGRTKSVTGSGVVAQYYTYGVSPDGKQWMRVATARPDSPMWERTTTDLLGRTILVEKPGPVGVESFGSSFDASGRLLLTSTSGMANTLYEYDELGQQVRSGLDINGSSALEPASSDRISESEMRYTQGSGDWWQETIQRVYAAENVATATVIGVQRTRANGFVAAGVVEEQITTDIHGNETRSWVTLDRNQATETRNVYYPDSDTTETQTISRGALLYSTSKTGVTTTFEYDALSRRSGVIDPRTGKVTTHYDEHGWVDYVEDAAAYRTLYGYDQETGRKVSETNALGKVAHFAYDSQGRLLRTWGETNYPVKQEYDDYGRLVRMTTYRGEAEWNSLEWPADTGPGDLTTWQFDEATGLLSAKYDAAGKSATYTYTTGGRLGTRTWARRTEAGDPIVTTYTYSPETGELTTVDYSDGTPDISYIYDRLGRQQTVTDAIGSRTFTYTATLEQQDEQLAGLFTETITREYDDAEGEVPGRVTGVNLGSDYHVSYDYDSKGRMNNVAWLVSGSGGHLQYSHLGNSNLIGFQQYNAGLWVSYGYEAHRDVRTSVRHETPQYQIRSLYGYVYDGAGRRTSVTNQGSAFTQSAFNKYDYDERSQLAQSRRYLGADVNNTAQQVTSQRRYYTYDPIGNRATGTVAYDLHNTYTSNQLNQYNLVADDYGGSVLMEYDDDGNMTAYTPGGQTTLYRWDAENRLVAVEPSDPLSGDRRISYRYDYLGRRVEKSIEVRQVDGSWSVPGGTTQFLYDGWNLIREQLGTGQVINSYAWGLDLSGTLQGAGGIGGLAAMITGGSSYYYLYDANGNVSQVINPADGYTAFRAKYEYDPYGKMISSSGVMAAENKFRFSTKYADEDTGLYYYGFRYYSPDLGRWLSRDPLGENGGVNNYNYVYNSPVDRTDYLGLWNDGNFGNTSADPGNRGHSDFPGHRLFDYTLEDKGFSSPFNPDSTWRHFRPLADSEADLVGATKECVAGQFERAAHQMQDFFSHYGQGFRAKDELNYMTLLKAGHGVSSAGSSIGRFSGFGAVRPDNAVDYRRAYEAATMRTGYWVNRWTKCCCKTNCTWVRLQGRSETECGAPAPENKWGDRAPSPNPEPGYMRKGFDISNDAAHRVWHAFGKWF